jgi:steroid Delta-isomerase
MTDARDIEQVFEKYAAAWSSCDLDAVTALFASDAVVHDPVDGPGVEGREKIRAFFEEFAGGVVKGMQLAGPVHISADCRHAAARLNADADLGEGLVRVEALDVMTFDDDGMITTMHAYWGPTNFHPA